MDEINNTEIYSTRNDVKKVAAGRFTRTSANKICKYMTSVSKKIETILQYYSYIYQLEAHCC